MLLTCYKITKVSLPIVQVSQKSLGRPLCQKDISYPLTVACEDMRSNISFAALVLGVTGNRNHLFLAVPRLS